MAETTVVNRGPGTFSILGVAFVVLKLTGVIDWSWWWVTLPFWGGFAFALVFFVVALIVYILGGAALDVKRQRNRRKFQRRRGF